MFNQEAAKGGIPPPHEKIQITPNKICEHKIKQIFPTSKNQVKNKDKSMTSILVTGKRLTFIFVNFVYVDNNESIFQILMV